MELGVGYWEVCFWEEYFPESFLVVCSSEEFFVEKHSLTLALLFREEGFLVDYK